VQWAFVAIATVVLVVGAWIGYRATETGETDRLDYTRYEEVLRRTVDLDPELRSAEITHLEGPFYEIRGRVDCGVVDVSTQYEGEASDHFWVAYGEC
jgi:hypothetical protein